MNYATSKLVIYISLLMGVVLLFSSCEERQNSKRLLVMAQTIVNDKPDSALSLLYSILFPEYFDEERYSQYILAKVQAKYKSYKSVKEDTLIFAAHDYFKRDGSYEQKAYSAMYAGIVSIEIGDLKKAMKYFESGVSDADKTNNYDLKGLIQSEIGHVCYHEMLYTEALPCFREALRCFSLSVSDSLLRNKLGERECHIYSMIGKCFILSGDRDSAYHYFNKGLEIAKSITERPDLFTATLNDISVLYIETGIYAMAKSYLQQAYRSEHDREELFIIMLNLSRCYDAIGKTDSANYFRGRLIEQSDSIGDLFLASSLYSDLSEYACSRGNFREAWEYQKKYNEIIVDINDQNLGSSLMDIKRESVLDKLRLQYKNRQITDLWILIAFIVTLVIIITWTIILYIWKIRNRVMLVEAEQKIAALNEMAEGIKNDAESELKSSLFQRFDIVKKISLLSSLDCYRSMDGSSLLREFNKIVYSEEYKDTWSAMYDMINKLTRGIPDKVKEEYPLLDETEYQIFIYSYAGLSAKEIAILLNKQVNTIYNKRTIIRKKIGIETISEAEFLNNKYGKLY